MIHRRVSSPILGLVLVSVLLATGCNTSYGPRFGIFTYPIPLTPYLQDQEEQRFWEKSHYKGTPVLEPFTPGGPSIAMDPPTQDEVMRKLEKAHPSRGGIPFLHEIQRNNVRVVVEQISDSVDPPRVYPLVGPAQLHHAHYKCTVYYSEVVRVGWPIPYTTKKDDSQEVIYIDHDHLHMVGNVSSGTAGGPATMNPPVVPIPTPSTSL